MFYFSTGVSLLYKGRFQAGKVGVMSILLRARVVVSEDLTVDYSFFGVFEMIGQLITRSKPPTVQQTSLKIPDTSHGSIICTAEKLSC